MAIYQPNIPIGTTQLDVDYSNIQGNFQVANTSFGIDHVPFSQSMNAGYHNVVHLVPVVSNPPLAVTGIGELYTYTLNDGFSTDTTLFFQSGAGLLTQLTRNFAPVEAANGYTYLTGGLVFQWGTQTIPVNIVSGSIVFATNNKAFPNNCFNVQVSFVTAVAPTSIGSISILGGSVSQTGFTYVNTQASTKTQAMYWTAIGN